MRITLCEFGTAMKKTVLRLIEKSGGLALARAMTARMSRILMYHNFSAAGSDTDAIDAFELRRQLAYLRRHFQVVPLTQIFEQLKRGAPLDRLTVAVTVDDGRRNCYEILFPLLKEFEIPATIFVVTSFVRGEDWIWTDKVLWLSEQPLRPVEFSAGEIESLFGRLNQLRPEARNAFIADTAARMGVSIPGEAPPRYAACSWSELCEMASSGLVEIGSHTMTHPILASITEEESWRELSVSRAQIEEALERPVQSFCFPNGKPGDYRPSQVQQVIDAGYAGAVVADFGMVTNRADPYQLPRLGVSGRSDPLAFSKNVDGAEYYQIKLQTSLRLCKTP